MPNGNVSKAECRQRMAPLVADVGTIKRALVGEDMRGGLVRDVSDMKQELTGILYDRRKRESTRTMWKIAAFSAMASAATAFAALIVQAVLGG